MRILHAIHDFLPQHQAGSEIYAFELCRALSTRHHVTVVCAAYDPSATNGIVRWRAYEGLPVVEIVNNWACASFADTYAAPAITARLSQVMRAVQPDVLHVHNLLNLSFELPALARARGIPVVATLHDYTLVCPSGGQRIHRAESHVCRAIDPSRCARCFTESPIHDHIALTRLGGATRAPALVRRAAASAMRRVPSLAGPARRAVRSAALRVTAQDIEARLAHARRLFDQIDLFVAPSPSIAAEFERLGVPAARIQVSDYGFVPLPRPPRRDVRRPLRFGYVGTLVWHKGVHVLVDALRALPRDAYELRIFGNVGVFPDYVAALRGRAAGLPVQFMGPFPRECTADAYAAIDVLVVPSLWLENSPLVIHEAFMAGVPVVGARIGGIADLIADGVNGLLYEADDPAGLARALRALVDDPSIVQALAAAAPRVKTIERDVVEWESAYATVARADVPAVQIS